MVRRVARTVQNAVARRLREETRAAGTDRSGAAGIFLSVFVILPGCQSTFACEVKEKQLR